MGKKEYENLEKEEIEELLLKEIEKTTDSKIPYAILVILLLIFGLVVDLCDKNSKGKELLEPITCVLIIAAIYTGLYIYCKKEVLNKKYKSVIMPSVIEKVMGECYYDLDKFVDKELFYESELYEKKDNSKYTGSDFIEYDRDKISTVASRLKVTYTTGSGRNISCHTQFAGDYFINAFEKKFEEEKVRIVFNKKLSRKEKRKEFALLNMSLILSVFMIVLLSFSIGRGMGAILITMILFAFINLKKYVDISGFDEKRKFVEKYGKEFSNFFLINGSYTIANKILTKEVTELLIELQKENGVKTNISIKDNILYIAFDTGIDLFTTKLFEDNKEKYLKDYYLVKKLREANDYIADKVLQAVDEFDIKIDR